MFPDNILEEIERKARTAERKAHRKGLRGERQEGEAASLLRLLERRFREIPSEIRERIATAELALIGEWFDRAIDAPDLETVFRAH